MNKDVLIHVRGLQMMETDDAREPIEIVVPGQYYFRNGSHYLRYEEMLDDTAETTVNYIKMSPNGVEVRKQGQVNVHMVFEEGKKNKTFYNTPYGTLQMGISATGGSVVYCEEAMNHLRSIGTVVYLKLSLDSLAKRLGNLQCRGVLLKDGQTLKDLYEERTPLYEKYADVVLDEEGKDLEESLHDLLEILEENSK